LPYIRHVLFGEGQGESATDMIRSLEDVIYAMQRQMSFLATAEQVEALAKAKPAQRPVTMPATGSGVPLAGPKADWAVIEQHLAKRSISPPSRKTVKEVLAMLGIID